MPLNHRRYLNLGEAIDAVMETGTTSFIDSALRTGPGGVFVANHPQRRHHGTGHIPERQTTNICVGDAFRPRSISVRCALWL